MNTSVVLKSIEEVLSFDHDEYSMLYDLSENFELSFKNSHLIKTFSNDLHSLKAFLHPKGLCFYFYMVGNISKVEKTLETLKEIKSPNYKILKLALDSTEVTESGKIETENYDDSDDWDNWSYEDSQLLLDWLETNKKLFK